jgi:hypothetical protein
MALRKTHDGSAISTKEKYAVKDQKGADRYQRSHRGKLFAISLTQPPGAQPSPHRWLSEHRSRAA